jgi:hypothetical protein
MKKNEIVEMVVELDHEKEVKGIITIQQELVITEALKPYADEVVNFINDLLNLEVNEETYKQIDKYNAEVTKMFEALENKRKETKRKALEPYEKFEAIYKNLVTEPYKEAKTKLKNKLDEVKNTLQSEKQQELEAYVTELLQAYNLDWLTIERLPIKINRSGSLTKAKNEMKILLDKVKQEQASITDNEVMVEYKRSLNLAQALQVVTERKKLLEQEKEIAEKVAQAKKEAEQKSKENAEKAKTVTPTPKQFATPVEASEQLYEVTFKVCNTKEQFVKLREFMIANGMEYEKLSQIKKG